MLMERRKLLIKVDKNGSSVWTHLCYVNSELWQAFCVVTGANSLQLPMYLSTWLREDFNVSLRVEDYEDVVTLKGIIEDRFQEAYPELYTLNEYENPEISGWLRLWLSQHMRVEITKLTGERIW